MRADLAQAERNREVREAARGWQRTGAIDEETRTKIDGAYPDDRARLGPVFRVLVFGFTMIAVSSCFSLFGIAIAAGGEKGGGVVLAFFGILLAAATEVQMGRFRRRQGGTEAATGFLAVTNLLGGCVWMLFVVAQPVDEASGNVVINLALIGCGIVLAVAAYRWGYTLYAILAAGAFYAILARTGFGRVLWMVVPVIVAPLLLRAADSAKLAPAHRRACSAVAVVSLVFLYLAVHLGSWDLGVVEMVAENFSHILREPSPIRSFFVAATALVPLVTIAFGIATRRRLLMDVGFVGLLASIVTLRVYVHALPLWIALLLGGGVALGIALALRRYLDSGPGNERHGFTGEPLFADPEGRSALEIAASVASFTPAARPGASPGPGGFEGGGGSSGGGGATDNF